MPRWENFNRGWVGSNFPTGAFITQAARPVDYTRFKVADNEFSRLSLSDLVAARDLYHVF